MILEQATLLVVDDQLDNFDVIEMALTSEDYQLYYASNGLKALELLESISPDAILLDVMMPGMDGLEVCYRLKNDSRYKHIPIIMVTALTSKADLARCLDQGADDFISKPIDLVELRARVRSLLRIKAQHDELENLLKLREETLMMRADMSNMLVHDLRNPLATIMLAAGIVQRYIHRPDQQPIILKKVDQILDSGQRLQRMIDNLLLMAKLEAGKFLFDPVPTDLHEFGSSIITDFQLIAAASNIQLKTEFPEPGNLIFIDTTILRRIIDNLVANALKFSPAASQVTLGLDYLPQDRLQIKVADEGPGISPEAQQQIFKKFEVGVLRQNVSQIGLGLTFCKMAVEAQGGSLDIRPNSPQGSVFMVEIPVSEENPSYSHVH
ncbi:MAG: response regulator [Snowella sp.]|nr:response regulator [Snowella sp.]